MTEEEQKTDVAVSEEEEVKTNPLAMQRMLGKMVTEAEADARVSGMQSTMAKQIDALKAELAAKAEDFKNQLRAKDEELARTKDEAIGLAKKLEDAEGELRKAASALEEKDTALATLNANVNTPAEELPTLSDGLAKCTTPAERSAFVGSGKYRKNH